MKFDLAEMKRRSKTMLPTARLKQLRRAKSPEAKELLGHIAWLQYLQAKLHWKLDKFVKRWDAQKL
jgi:hypothetical protein